MTDSPRTIVITGASSGVGEALAREWAAPGVVLALTGRHAARLAAVAQTCRHQGAEVEERVIDVADRAAMAQWLTDLDHRHPVDIVIANAGISGGTAHGEDADQTNAIFATNVNGVLNTVLPLVDAMRARRRGRIVLIASLAGYRGLPTAPAYCASKAAVKVWGEGLRGWLAADGVSVTVVCPGFIRSRITDANDFPMPFFMEADRAARIIRRGIERGVARLSFPWPMAALTWLVSILPPSWIDPLLVRAPKKG